MKAAALVLLALVALVLWLAHLRKGTGTESLSPQAVQTEEPSRPGPAPGQGASLARAGLPADAMPEAVEGVGAADTLDLRRSAGGLENLRRHVRHRWVKLYLTTPARGTEAFAQLEALCRKHGYGPWAVGPAYSYAWEMASFDRFRAKVASGENAERGREIMAVAEAAESNRVVRMMSVSLGVEEWHPDFLAAVRQIQPVVFFGQYWEAMLEHGEEMLDGLSWEAVEARATN